MTDKPDSTCDFRFESFVTWQPMLFSSMDMWITSCGTIVKPVVVRICLLGGM